MEFLALIGGIVLIFIFWQVGVLQCLFGWIVYAAGFVIGICAVLLALFIISGCASVPLTEDQEYNRQVSAENWAMCEAIMVEQHATQALHYHHHGRNNMYTRPWMITQDLSNNFCKRRLGRRWAEKL